MRVLEQRILRGPNRWAAEPCLQTLVDFGSTIATAPSAALLALVPQRPRSTPELLAQLALALQARAGVQRSLAMAIPVPGTPTQARIVFAFAHEDLACQAMALALDLIADGAAATRLLEQRMPALLAAYARGSASFPHADKPIVAVTGTNGKTTTTLMIAHCIGQAGKITGVTTTEGIFIDGQQVDTGDCAGFHSARTVLADSRVEYAVLETARGGILKRGLAFQQCDVGVITNISEDHLGLDGVETLEELAHVKGLVARQAATAVLNADDPLCVSLARTLAPDAKPVWFSLKPDSAVLAGHLSRGGQAAWLDDGILMLDNGERRQPLMLASSLPCALQGHARYNIANALAAAGALMAAGFSVAEIASGLASFASTASTNPLRTNVYSIGGATIIIDYAHNPAAALALGATARSLYRNRRTAVVTAPGDRRDADLHQLGMAYAIGFDELYIYEADARGREPGETAACIASGARRAGMEAGRIHIVLPVADAFGAAISNCESGDVLVFACGSTGTAASLIEPHLERTDLPGQSHLPWQRQPSPVLSCGA